MKFFKSLKDIEIVKFKKCYKSCNSHCCGKDNVLPMLEAEFLAMKENINPLTLDYFYKDLKLKCGVKIKIYFIKCDKLGLCLNHQNRPLVCKLYPYFPIIDENANLLGVREISFYDLFYKNDKNHPCTLVNTHKKELLAMYYQNIKQILNEPIMIFVFMALEILTNYLQNYVKNKHKDVDFDRLNKDIKKDFFAKNDIFVALKDSSFQNDINNLYLKLEKLYKQDLSKHFSK